MEIMVHSFLWVMQDLYHQPFLIPQEFAITVCVCVCVSFFGAMVVHWQ